MRPTSIIRRRSHTTRPARRRASGHAPGACGPALVEAILLLRGAALAEGRSHAAPAAAGAVDGPQPRLAPHLQPRRPLHARHVGVSRGTRRGTSPSIPSSWRGSIPTRPRSSSRSCCANGTCIPNGQVPAYEFSFSDVNPPVHAWAAWRVYKITGPRGGARREVSRKHLPEAAHELHLVGEPQGLGRAQSFRGRISRARQHRRVRPLEAAGRRQFARAGRRHGVDGVVLPDHAQHGAGAGDAEQRSTRTSPRSSSSISSRSPGRSTRLAARDSGTPQDGFYYDRIAVKQGSDVPLKVRSIVGLMPLLAVTGHFRTRPSRNCRISPSG